MATGLQSANAMFQTFRIPMTWSELIKRTINRISRDNALGLAAQLSFYLLLALVPAILFMVALTSFFPARIVEQLIASLSGVAPQEVVTLLREQLQAISEGQHTGLLTFGFAMALWSSSAAVVAATDALNRAYDIEESRPWWKVRLTAILMTLALAVLVIVSLGLVLAGPQLAEWLAANFGFGPVFEWSWKILQWPLVFFLITLGVGLLYNYGPDAEQDWEWITPGALVATLLWIVASLALRFYVTNFGAYQETYGTIGGIIVLMLWFYISSLAILVGAAMSAEIEHASPHGKEAGEKVPGERKKLGAAAAREYEKRSKKAPSGGTPRRPVPDAGPSRDAVPDRVRASPTRGVSLGSILAGLPVFLTAWWFRRRTRN